MHFPSGFALRECARLRKLAGRQGGEVAREWVLGVHRFGRAALHLPGSIHRRDLLAQHRSQREMKLLISY